MQQRFAPPSRDVACHLGLFQARIEDIAERAGVPAYERLSLETMLTALPWPERRRVGLFLKGAKAQSDDAAVHRAADMLLSLAVEVWGEQPRPREAKPVPPSAADVPTKPRRQGS